MCKGDAKVCKERRPPEDLHIPLAQHKKRSGKGYNPPTRVGGMKTTCPVVRERGWRVPTLSTVQKLYEALRVEIRKPGAWERDSLVLTAYLAYTGARISEALQATTEDLFYDKGLVRIKGVKGGGFRVVPVPPEILFLLQRYVIFRGRADLLFPVTRQAAGEAVRRETRRLVGCSLSPHLLRHAFAIKLLTRGSHSSWVHYNPRRQHTLPWCAGGGGPRPRAPLRGTSRLVQGA